MQHRSIAYTVFNICLTTLPVFFLLFRQTSFDPMMVQAAAMMKRHGCPTSPQIVTTPCPSSSSMILPPATLPTLATTQTVFPTVTLPPFLPPVFPALSTALPNSILPAQPGVIPVPVLPPPHPLPVPVQIQQQPEPCLPRHSNGPVRNSRKVLRAIVGRGAHDHVSASGGRRQTQPIRDSIKMSIKNSQPITAQVVVPDTSEASRPVAGTVTTSWVIQSVSLHSHMLYDLRWPFKGN